MMTFAETGFLISCLKPFSAILRFFDFELSHTVLQLIKRTCQNIAGHYMENFLSLVTEKTFPGVYRSSFDDFFHFLIQNWRQVVFILSGPSDNFVTRCTLVNLTKFLSI